MPCKVCSSSLTEALTSRNLRDLLPHQPGFLIPTVPSAEAVTWTEVGSAEERGLELLSKAISAEPTAAHGSRVDG